MSSSVRSVVASYWVRPSGRDPLPANTEWTGTDIPLCTLFTRTVSYPGKGGREAIFSVCGIAAILPANSPPRPVAARRLPLAESKPRSRPPVPALESCFRTSPSPGIQVWCPVLAYVICAPPPGFGCLFVQFLVICAMVSSKGSSISSLVYRTTLGPSISPISPDLFSFVVSSAGSIHFAGYLPICSILSC